MIFRGDPGHVVAIRSMNNRERRMVLKQIAVFDQDGLFETTDQSIINILKETGLFKEEKQSSKKSSKKTEGGAENEFRSGKTSGLSLIHI